MNNPHPMFSDEWHRWKEENEGWVPYHVGTTPSGAPCPTMPRVVKARPGVYRCPACGKEFPTYAAKLAAAAEKP